MQRGPNNEHRPREPVACAVYLMCVATGEIDEPPHWASSDPPSGPVRAGGDPAPVTAASRERE